MSEPNGSGPRRDVPLRKTDRPDAPAYLRAYMERRSKQPPDAGEGGPTEAAEDSSLPLYLRRFRSRARDEAASPYARPVIPGEPEPTWTEPWAQTTKSPDLILPPDLRPSREGDDAVVDVHLMRHGETQGYSVSAGLTPMGRWQAQRRGHDLSKGVRDGEAVRIVCAPTARAQQTAEQVRRGVEDGLVLWGRSAPVEGPFPMEEFRNFGVWTPSGEKDVTAAFHQYHAVSERYDREAAGNRPLWLVEIDRFYRVQMGGGDAIHFWMTVPLLNFEPPAACVMRFWQGIRTAVAATPDRGHVFVPTHSGPIRALATWAIGHDAGEPYNVEEVRIKVRRSMRTAQVTYRNRTAEIQVPQPEQWPSWWHERAAAVQAAEVAAPAGS